MLEFDKKVDNKNPRFFDFKISKMTTDDMGNNIGSVEVEFHGNYAGVKSKTEALQYITKEIFTPEQALKNSPGFSAQLGSIYHNILVYKNE